MSGVLLEAIYSQSDIRVFQVVPRFFVVHKHHRYIIVDRGADKSLARPGTKQATATEDFDVYSLFIIIIGGILLLYIYIYIYIYI